MYRALVYIISFFLFYLVSCINSLPQPKADIGDLEGSTMTRQKRQISPQGHFKGYEIPLPHKGYDPPAFLPQTTVPPPPGLPPLPLQPLQTSTASLPCRRVTITTTTTTTTTTLPPCRRRFVTTTTLPPCPRTSNPIPSRDYRQSFRGSNRLHSMQSDESRDVYQSTKIGFRHYSSFQKRSNTKKS
uniref:Uncharacterized protein n=1 Tax=Lepeophtheirus salmonis TaxID=72036 RepID=A0A0K2VC79_LEPSM